MKAILDTHTLIWYLNGDAQLSKFAKEFIDNTANSKFVSLISLWEISIKISINKLYFNGKTNELINLIKQNGFNLLTITTDHIATYDTLPLINRDPFDRLIISQSIFENFTIVTKDENIKKYSVKTIW